MQGVSHFVQLYHRMKCGTHYAAIKFYYLCDIIPGGRCFFCCLPQGQVIIQKTPRQPAVGNFKSIVLRIAFESNHAGYFCLATCNSTW